MATKPSSTKKRDKDDTNNPDFQLPGIGNYVFQKTVGEGNFAKVKLAKHKLTGVEVAIKVIDKTTLDEKKLSKLYREVRIMKHLNHPHIVKLYEVIETKYTVFLVMEYASGGELYDYLVVHGKMKEKEARAKFRQILSAVSYCHKKKVIHRDLKAENLLLDSNLDIKIADFGFSNYFDPDGKLETFCGSPPYAAPELFQGRRYVGPEVDIWSLGVILYVLTTGCLPFDGKNLQEMRESVCRGKYRIPFYLSDNCEKLLRKFLVRDPFKRSSLDILSDDIWINEGYTPSESPFAGDLGVPLTEDEDVIKTLETKHNIDRETILVSLRENKYDDVAAIYYIVYFEKNSRSRRNTELSPSVPTINTGNTGSASSTGNSPPVASPVETVHSAMAALPSVQPVIATNTGTTAPTSQHASKFEEETGTDEVAPLPQLRPKVTAARLAETSKRRITVGSEADAQKYDVTSAESPGTATGNQPVVIEETLATVHAVPAVSRLNNAAVGSKEASPEESITNTSGPRQRAQTAHPTAIVTASILQSSATAANAEDSVAKKRGESIVGMIRNVGMNIRRRSEISTGAVEKSVVAVATTLQTPNEGSESTAGDLTESQMGIPRGDDANKPRSLRFTFNSNTTSSKSPDEIITEIVSACAKLSITHVIVTRYLMECVWTKGQEAVKFEIEVCKLPRLKSLYGLRFKRLSGSSSDYKEICEKLLAGVTL
ncbi:MAP/microtubule affinity-regulating kinase 3 [Entophlyctis luteolus]|nr:MAP/microtubule affinity-regulating kinase 3 [Entophlyctis luteolus]